MDKERIKDYTLRITQSNRTQLVVIIYEITLELVAEAREYAKENEWDNYKENLRKAGTFVRELMGALDFQYEISRELMSLYLYVNRTLIQAEQKQDPELLRGVEVVISGLKKSFEKLSLEDTSEPLMKNTQQVYEGFTYGPDSKGTVYQQATSSRGFKI